MDNIYVERNGVYNHWGIWVDPEMPITGVISNNSCVQFISDEMYDGIDIDYELHLESNDHIKDNCDCEDYWDTSQSTILIGDWIKDQDGLWDNDPNGEYAAIVNESTTQVIFSNNIKSCALCSPCYPGQADLDTPGDFKAYNLPKDAFDY